MSEMQGGPDSANAAQPAVRPSYVCPACNHVNVTDFFACGRCGTLPAKAQAGLGRPSYQAAEAPGPTGWMTVVTVLCGLNLLWGLFVTFRSLAHSIPEVFVATSIQICLLVFMIKKKPWAFVAFGVLALFAGIVALYLSVLLEFLFGSGAAEVGKFLVIAITGFSLFAAYSAYRQAKAY